jgi:Rieske Fe-S protein
MTSPNNQEARRHFLRGIAGVAFGATFLSIGAACKVFNFFFGSRLNQKQETELLAEQVNSLDRTLRQKNYELERQKSDYIFVSQLSDLNSTRGKYFIDYEMCPALAFLGSDNLPILLSAKCTHLGCTVGCDVNAQGKILCPCHISYFDVQTGKPNPDSPAKAPLPHIGWVLKDKSGKVVASKPPEGSISGSPNLNESDNYSVFIAKNFSAKVQV